MAVDSSSGHVIGCLGLVALRDGNVALKKMFVAKTYRKLGLGKKLLEEFITYCYENSKKAILYFLEQHQILKLLNIFIKNLDLKKLLRQIYLKIFHVSLWITVITLITLTKKADYVCFFGDKNFFLSRSITSWLL